MATTVGQHGVAAFTNPSNGDALDATVVKANDNTIRDAYVAHDSDPGIHVQSSLLAARPAAGTTGRKWITTDTGDVRVWYDNGSTWDEIAYLTGSSSLDANNLASGTVPDARFPATLPAASGANLTNLNANNLSSGTLPDARFPLVLPAISGAFLTNLPAAAAGTLTGTTLASNIVSSSLTSLGTLTSLTVAGTSTIQQALEKATISATAATGTINFDALSQAVLYYTSNASANWTFNLRGSSGTTLASVMSTGQSLTVAFLVTNGATAYYPTSHQIDGSSITPKWALNTPPAAGNPSSVDIYTYTVIKTALGFEMFASRTYYK